MRSADLNSWICVGDKTYLGVLDEVENWGDDAYHPGV
jgi:hypothetical protein